MRQGNRLRRLVPERRTVNKKDYITEEWQRRGLRLEEEGDHIVKLMKGKQTIAMFSQTGVDIENILREVEAGKYDNYS